MKKKTIYLVRHGESLGNAAHVLLGHTDIDLSPLGYRQAQKTAEALAEIPFDAIHSSDLLRAYHTAQAHADLRGMTVFSNKNLRETHLGDWENRPVTEVIKQYGKQVYFGEWQGGFGTFAFPNGESVQGACDRFYSEVERIANAAHGATLLVVAHGAVIRSFYARVMGLAAEDVADAIPFPSNASYSVVDFVDGKFYPVEFSHDEHLYDVGVTKVNW